MQKIHLFKKLSFVSKFRPVYVFAKKVYQIIWSSMVKIISLIASTLVPIEIFIRYQIPKDAKILKYTYPPTGGLGDRLGVTICLAALAKPVAA